MARAVLILAGGRGRRLGQVDKAALPCPAAFWPVQPSAADNGLPPAYRRTLLDAALRRYSPLAPCWIATGARSLPPLPEPLRQIPDRPGTHGKGPLAGLLAAFEFAAGSGVELLLSCPVDVLGVQPEVLNQLAQRLESDPGLQCVIASRPGTRTDEDSRPAAEQGRIEPLVAAWRIRPELVARCSAAIDAGDYAVHRLLAGLHHATLPLPETAGWLNLNSATDLRAAGIAACRPPATDRAP